MTSKVWTFIPGCVSANKMYYRNKTLTAEYRTWRQRAQKILPDLEIPEGPIELQVYAYFANKARDLDNILKPLQDTLQERYGFDDNRIYKITAVKMLVPKEHKADGEGLFIRLLPHKGNLTMPTFKQRPKTEAVLPVYTETGDEELTIWDVEMMDRRKGCLTHASHYVITRDGEIHPGRTPDNCIGNECADLDHKVLWIKLVGNPMGLTERQEASLTSLTTHLEIKYEITAPWVEPEGDDDYFDVEKEAGISNGQRFTLHYP